VALSILALEELGKLLAINGLLFAPKDDHKAMAFQKSGKDHPFKLQTFGMFPIFVYNVSIHDPRYGEKRFNQALAIAICNWKDQYNSICGMLKITSLGKRRKNPAAGVGIA